MRRLQADGFKNLLIRDRSELDLMDESAVAKFFLKEKPTIVICAAAKVGGIQANNDYPVQFLLDNLRIQNNVIRSAYDSEVRKLLFLGSSCIYPKLAPQPIPETALLSGPMKLTPLRRLPGSSSARRTVANTAQILSQRCRRISTGRTTISIWKHHMYWPRSYAKRTKPEFGTIKG